MTMVTTTLRWKTLKKALKKNFNKSPKVMERNEAKGLPKKHYKKPLAPISK